MSEYYLDLRSIHVATVAFSLLFFTFRGVGLLGGHKWPRIIHLRYATYLNDTLLLASAIVLMIITGFNPVEHAWLGVKVALLVSYVLLGIYAFRESRSFRNRLCSFLGAIVIYLFMISVARAHHPMGVFRQLF